MAMEHLTEFERAVLLKLLAGDDDILNALRAQLSRAHIESRTFTGVGFSLLFAISSELPPLYGNLNFEIGDVNGQVDGLNHGVGFVLFVRSGYLRMLEGYTYDEPWPAVIKSFELTYQAEPRHLDQIIRRTQMRP